MTTAMIWDGAALLLALIILFRGWYRGLLASLVGLVGTVASGIAAILLSLPLSQWLYDTFLGPWLGAAAGQILPEQAEATIQIYNSSPSSGELLEQFGFSLSDLSEQIQEMVNSGVASAGQAIMEGAVQPLVQTLVRVLCFVVLFLLFGLALKVLLWLFQRFNEVPVLGFANRCLGLLLGAAEAMLLVYIFSLALTAVASIGGWEILNPALLEQTQIIRRAAAWNWVAVLPIS